MELDSASLGYILDFLAGFFIIQSIILRSVRHIKLESSTLFDGNPLVYESQLKAFWDGWIGVGLLLIGLIFHLLHFDIEYKFFLIVTMLSVVIPVIFKYCINKQIAKEVRKEYSFYDEVKKRIE